MDAHLGFQLSLLRLSTIPRSEEDEFSRPIEDRILQRETEKLEALVEKAAITHKRR